MARGMARFHATTLIDRHVDQHTPWLHQPKLLPLNQARRLGTRNQNGTDNEICPLQLFADCMSIAKKTRRITRGIRQPSAKKWAFHDILTEELNRRKFAPHDELAGRCPNKNTGRTLE